MCNCGIKKRLKRIERKLDILLLRGVSAQIALSPPCPTKTNVVAPSVSITDIQQGGFVLVLVDAVGNSVPVPSDATVQWSTDDITVLTVVADAADQTKAIVSSTGKIGEAVLSAAVTFAGPVNSLTANTLITVTTSAPTATNIVLGPPTP